ncbi:MAG: YdcF family protein [Ardenticatenaceae bacterium]|nr:YdcF family protein [Ardenticatenaceae bacterium]MCB8990023.1 YdcF family protein [Ardenticatenaceae bacterium]
MLMYGTAVCLFIALSPFIWRKGVQWWYGRSIYTPDTAPNHQVAIVFGAAVYGNGRLSPVLMDRMDTAIQLYHDGTVQKILVSGDNSTTNYDEPGAMMEYAIQRGVTPDDVQPDYAGRRTYDTCYRAREIFQLDSAILVTQQFHLPRALFTCQRLGMDVVGVAADLQPYRDARWYEVRETLATAVALWDTIRQQPAPILGEPIPINE